MVFSVDLWVAILITALGCFLVGLRGMSLLAVSVLAFVPVLLLCTFVSDSVLPVPLEAFPNNERMRGE